MRVLVLLADGCEEMEAVILIDVLRRANWEVTAASIESQKAIRASRGVGLEADVQFDEVDYSTYDLLVLPGVSVGLSVWQRMQGCLKHWRILMHKKNGSVRFVRLLWS